MDSGWLECANPAERVTLFFCELYKVMALLILNPTPRVIHWNEKFDLPEDFDDINDVKLGIDNEPASFHKYTGIIARQWGETSFQLHGKRLQFLLQSGG